MVTSMPKPDELRDVSDALKPKAVREEAWRIHRAEGHPEGYEGPCWGPTAANVEQARKNLAPSGDGDTDA